MSIWDGMMAPVHPELIKHIRHRTPQYPNGHAPHMPDHIIIQSIELVDADFDPRLEELISDEVDIAELGDGEFQFWVTIGWEGGEALYHFIVFSDNPDPDSEEVKQEVAQYFRNGSARS